MTATHCTFAFNDNACINQCDYGVDVGSLQIKNSVVANTNKTNHTYPSVGVTINTCSLYIAGVSASRARRSSPRCPIGTATEWRSTTSSSRRSIIRASTSVTLLPLPPSTSTGPT